MKKNRSILFNLAVILGVAFVFSNYAQAQSAIAEKKRICVGPINVINALKNKAAKNNRADELQQVVETLDTTLINQINESRKFEIVARKDSLKALINEQDFGASGNIDPATAAQAFKLAGAQYLVLTTITDFTMGQEKVEFSGIGSSAQHEAVRVSCSVQIYDTTTGKLIESARFRGQDNTSSRTGDATGEGASITKNTDRLAADILNRITEVIYPAKVVAKLGTQVTINRGDNAGVSVDQTWAVFAQGEEIVDPDTGEKLGHNEAEVGSIKITRITPKLSYGEVVEDNGIVIGAVVRAKQAGTAKSSEATGKPVESKKLAEKIKDDL